MDEYTKCAPKVISGSKKKNSMTLGPWSPRLRTIGREQNTHSLHAPRFIGDSKIGFRSLRNKQRSVKFSKAPKKLPNETKVVML